jgi:hypothetical protein
MDVGDIFITESHPPSRNFSLKFSMNIITLEFLSKKKDSQIYIPVPYDKKKR